MTTTTPDLAADRHKDVMNRWLITILLLVVMAASSFVSAALDAKNRSEAKEAAERIAEDLDATVNIAGARDGLLLVFKRPYTAA